MTLHLKKIYTKYSMLIWQKRRSHKLYWKLFIKCDDLAKNFFLCLKKNIFYPAIKKEIKNQRILIIGSGVSANDLEMIPDDVKIFTLKRGINLLLQKNIRKKCDLYFCHKYFFVRDKLKDPVLRSNINLFITDETRYMKNIFNTKDMQIIKCHGPELYYTRKFIKARTFEIPGKVDQRMTTNGVRLIQYACYYGAKEIYIIGIDLGKSHYFWGGNKSHKMLDHHVTADRNFIKMMSQKHKNIYSLSKNSPISEYIPVREFS